MVAPGVVVVTPAMSPYALGLTDRFLLILADTGPVDVTLPLSTGPDQLGRAVDWFRLDFTGNLLRFLATAPENVNGLGSAQIPGPGASYSGGRLRCCGDDGVGFVNGWAAVDTADGMLVLQAGPSLLPAVPVLKLGSSLRSIQPYCRGFYLSAARTIAVNNDQLQSYDDVGWVNTTAGPFNVLLNGLERGQVHRVKNIGTGGNALTVLPQGGHTIDGNPNAVLADGQAADFIADPDLPGWRQH